MCGKKEEEDREEEEADGENPTTTETQVTTQGLSYQTATAELLDICCLLYKREKTG